MAEYVRSVARSIYKVKHIVLLVTAVAAILFLSAFIGKNTFFNKQTGQAPPAGVASSNVSKPTGETEGMAAVSAVLNAQSDNGTAKKTDPMVAGTNNAPTTTSKESCNDAERAELLRRYDRRVREEKLLHEEALQKLQKEGDSLLSVAESTLASLLQTESDRHNDKLAALEDSHMLELRNAGCL